MKSGTVRTVKGTVKASERLLSDSGVVQYKIPDGWVSDINAIEVLEYPESVPLNDIQSVLPAAISA